MKTFYSWKSLFIAVVLVCSIFIGGDAFAQSYQIVGPKTFNLKEGDSVKIEIKNLQKSLQYVLVAIVNPDPDHLHIPADGSKLTSLALPMSTYGDSAIFYCSYFPRALHPVTAYIYISDSKHLQNDTITLISTDTSDGKSDPLRIKQYLRFSSPDTVRFLTTKNSSSGNGAKVEFSNINFATVLGYAMLRNTSGNFTISNHQYYLDLYNVNSTGIPLDYKDNIGYGNRDTAMLILYSFLPKNAKPDTIMFYESDDELVLTVGSPDFTDVPKGSTTCRPLKIINQNDSAAMITSIPFSGDAARFAIDPLVVFPLMIPAHSEKSIMVCYSAPDTNKAISGVGFVLLLKAFDGRTTSTGNGSIAGSTDFGCYSVSKDTLMFTNVIAGNSIEDSIAITNNLNSSVVFYTGEWTYLEPNSNLFSVVKNTFPLQLAPGEKKYIHFTFNPNQKQTGKYYGLFELDIKRYPDLKGADTLCQNLPVQLIASADAPSSVKSNSEKSPDITIIPNPAREQVMIRSNGIHPALFEIYNALGERIAEKNQVTEWLWNPAHERVSDGIYFVRISGLSEDGSPFVTTKRIVVEK
jgi:hypothetical protein